MRCVGRGFRAVLRRFAAPAGGMTRRPSHRLARAAQTAKDLGEGRCAEILRFDQSLGRNPEAARSAFGVRRLAAAFSMDEAIGTKAAASRRTPKASAEPVKIPRLDDVVGQAILPVRACDEERTGRIACPTTRLLSS